MTRCCRAALFSCAGFLPERTTSNRGRGALLPLPSIFVYPYLLPITVSCSLFSLLTVLLHPAGRPLRPIPAGTYRAAAFWYLHTVVVRPFYELCCWPVTLPTPLPFGLPSPHVRCVGTPFARADIMRCATMRCPLCATHSFGAAGWLTLSFSYIKQRRTGLDNSWIYLPILYLSIIIIRSSISVIYVVAPFVALRFVLPLHTFTGCCHFTHHRFAFCRVTLRLRFVGVVVLR